MVSSGKAKKFLYRNRFFFGSFFLLIIYNFAIVNNFTLPTVEGERYSFHVVDFSFGFCSKFLQGAFFRLFVKEPTELKATVYGLILLCILFLSAAFFINVISRKIPEEYHAAYAVLTAFFLTGPFTFAIFSYRPGMPDFSWIFLAALFFICFSRKKLRFAIPFLCAAGVMVHYGFLISYVLLFAVIVLYEITLSDDKKDRKQLWLLFFAMAVCTGAAFLYFFLNDKNNLVYSHEEFIGILKSYGAGNSRIMEYYLYDETQQYGVEAWNGLVPEIFLNENAAGLTALAGKICKLLAGQKIAIESFGIKTVGLKFIASAALTMPILFIYLKTAAYGYGRTDKSRLCRFAFFCISALFFATVFLSVLFSVDVERWFGHALSEIFAVFYYMIYREKGRIMEFLKKEIEKTNPLFLAGYFCLYFFTVMDPYT